MSKILNNASKDDSNAEEAQTLTIMWYGCFEDKGDIRELNENGSVMDMTGDLEVTTIEAAEAALPEILSEMIEDCNDEEHIDSTMRGFFIIQSEDDSSDKIACEDVNLKKAPKSVIAAIERAEKWRNEKDDADEETA